MKISDYLNEELCLMELKAKNKKDVIKEIAEELDKHGAVVDRSKFVKDVLEREELGSTGIGDGVAIPHARTESVSGFLIGFGRSKNGVEFKALDGEPVSLFFLMGAHPDELNLYLRLLAELSKLLMNNAFRTELKNAKTSKDIVEIVKRFEAK